MEIESITEAVPKPNSRLRRFLPEILRRSPLIVTLTLVVSCLIAIDAVQYSRYGSQVLLGWDTPTYAWWAELVQLNGPVAMVSTWHYPWLYVLVLALAGTIIGNVTVAEKILPLIVFLPLAFGLYRTVGEIASNRRLGYLAALLSPVTIETLRIYSDLNRQLLASGVSLIIGGLIASRLSLGVLDWKKDRKLIVAKWLPTLALIAYTQLETYAVLVISLLLLFALSRHLKTLLIGVSTMLAPLAVALPLMFPYYLTLQGAAAGLIQQPEPSVLRWSWLFLGGYALPWVSLGVAYLVRIAKVGNPSARFLTLWLFTLLLLSPIAQISGIGLYRVVLLFPVPALGVLGITPLVKGIRTIGNARLAGRGEQSNSRWLVLTRASIGLALVALLLVPTLFTTYPNASEFLRPYAYPQDISRLQFAGEIAVQSGYTNPILVLYGSDVIQLWSAYFGISVPRSLPYYGKLQYLFTLPVPSSVYTFQYSPAYELKYSTEYTNNIRASITSLSDIASRAIVVVTGNTYNRPFSEPFINSTFERAPGIFIIPPNSLSAEQVDDWRLFAFYDRSGSVSGYGASGNWSVAPLVLESVSKPPNAAFLANYTVSLQQSWSSMDLVLHYWDWGPLFYFNDGSTMPLAPINVYLDNRLIISQNYSLAGQATISTHLTNVNAGLHRINVESSSASVGVAVRLDYLEIHPLQR